MDFGALIQSVKREIPHFWFLAVKKNKALFFILVFFLMLFLLFAWHGSNAGVSLSASITGSMVVVLFLEALRLQRELGNIKKLWPFCEQLMKDRREKVYVTVASIPIDSVDQVGSGVDRLATGSGEAMALSVSIRALTNLGLEKYQIIPDYAHNEDNGLKDKTVFKDTPSCRLILGGPVYCKVSEYVLDKLSSNQLKFERKGDWVISYSGQEWKRIEDQRIDIGLIAWGRQGEHWWVLLAGCGTEGVIAASEAVTHPRYAEIVVAELAHKRVSLDKASFVVLKCEFEESKKFLIKDIQVLWASNLQN